MNTALINKVAAFITANPRRFDMGRAAGGKGKNWTACIAGLTVKIGEPETFTKLAKIQEFKPQLAAMVKEAQRLLKIDTVKAGKLFWVMGWPERFRRFSQKTEYALEETYWTIDDPVKLAELATRRIAAFIQQDKP